MSFVLWGAGLGQSLLAGQVPSSWTLENAGLPGAGQWVTVYAGTSGGQGHTFIEVAGIVLDTVHGSATTPAGTGPRWQPASEVAYELATGSFVTRHPQDCDPPTLPTRARRLSARSRRVRRLALQADDVGRDTSRVDDADHDHQPRRAWSGLAVRSSVRPLVGRHRRGDRAA